MSWPKHLTVDKRIVKLLSASTYENFPRALRELVSNAYDADATEVEISISQKNKSVVVKDNGSGMTPDEFDFFLRIAGRQRSKSRTAIIGRERIGQFGIGFLAMFPFCKTVQVESTTSGSTITFVAQIPASQFCRDGAAQDVTEAAVKGIEKETKVRRNDHFTIIRLLDTTPLLDHYFRQSQATQGARFSIRSKSGMERLRWELQEILPLPYPPDSLVGEIVSPTPLNFRVSLNSRKLIVNDYVDEVLAKSKSIESVGKINFTWVIGTPWKAVRPDEARGLRVKLHHVGVGPRQYFDLGTLGRAFSRLHWLTGEVNVVGGLDESITLDRDNFTQSQDYEDFREFFRKTLRKCAFYVEDVDEAKRKISAQISQSPRAAVASSRDVVRQQVDRLKKRGFKVQRKQSRTKSTNAHVEIDTKRKIVTLPKESLRGTDSVVVGGKSWNIKYDSFDKSGTSNKPYEVTGSRTIVLNTDYPLFKGAHKDVFRRLQLIIAQAEQSSRSKKEFISVLQQKIVQEFSK